MENIRKMQTASASAYTLAGDRLHPFERIVESPSVSIPLQTDEGQGERAAFRAPARSRRRAGLSLAWALLLILGTVAIMSLVSLQKVAQGKQLQSGIELLRDRYLEAEGDRRALHLQYLEASDGSFVSYYAAQNLGMKRALHEETIQVVAANTRPTTPQGVSGLGGIATGYSSPTR